MCVCVCVCARALVAVVVIKVTAADVRITNIYTPCLHSSRHIHIISDRSQVRNEYTVTNIKKYIHHYIHFIHFQIMENIGDKILKTGWSRLVFDDGLAAVICLVSLY